MPEASKAKAKQPQPEPMHMPFFDPFTQMAPYIQDGIDRLQAFYDELSELEQAAYDRSKQLTTQVNDMVAGTMQYATALAGEWRKITLESTQRTAQMFRDKV